MTGDPTQPTPNGCSTRQWRLISTDYTFNQQTNPGKGTWNTGCFNKKLKIIAKDAKLKFGLQLATRADFILRNRSLKNAMPARQLAQTDFFSMAEDLPHHVRAMKMVASTGVPNSFFENVFVKDYLANLEPRHRAIYRRTLLRLLRVFVDCQNKEVSNRYTVLSFTLLFYFTCTAPLIIFQIGVFCTENHLQYGYGCGSSNSDFWKDPGRMEPFGAVCINTIAKRYIFKNGLEMAISDTTFNEMAKHGEIGLHLRSTNPLFGRTTFLGDFARVDGKKTAEKLAEFIIASHTKVNWKMSCIISHVVDSAANAVAGSEEMKYLTKDDRPLDVFMMKCMPHKGSTAALAASGTSDHVGNLNPVSGEILNKCHRLTERIHRKRARRDEVEAVHRAKKRTKYPSIQPGVVTRWGSYHKESTTFNCVRHDVDEALKNLLAEGGCDNDLLNGEDVNETEVFGEHTLDELEWEFLHQYEGALDRIYRLIVFMQKKRAMAHDELFELMSCLEHLSCKFFLIYNDISKSEEATNLQERVLNICVTEPGFKFIGNTAPVLMYKTMDQEKAVDAIRLCRRICFRQMGVKVRVLFFHNP